MTVDPSQHPRPSPQELTLALAALSKHQNQPWVVVVDRLDHGPFSAQELVEQIIKGAVGPTHFLRNMDTRQEGSVTEFNELSPFLVEQQHRQIAQRIQEKEARSKRRERRTRVFFAVIAVAVVGGLSAGTYLLLKPSPKQSSTPLGNQESLYASPEVHLGTASQAQQRGSTRSSRPGSPRGAMTPEKAKNTDSFENNVPHGPLNYDQAMAIPMAVGDLDRGSERQLSDTQVAQRLNHALPTVEPCLREAKAQGIQPGIIQLRLAIQGTGQVMGVTVQSNHGDLRQCIAQKIRRVRFPTFPAPRMGATYAFDAS